MKCCSTKASTGITKPATLAWFPTLAGRFWDLGTHCCETSSIVSSCVVATATSSVLVSFGGVDRNNQALKCLSALAAVQEHTALVVTLVAGWANPHLERLRRWCAPRSWIRFCHHADNMAERMAEADLAIGAGGTTTLERMFVGLPTITMAIADNQRHMLEDLGATGAVWHLGWHQDVGPEDVTELVARLRGAPDEVRRASEVSLALARPAPNARDAPSAKEQIADTLLGVRSL